MMTLTYKKAEFKEVREIWKNYLWMARTSEIEPVSAIDKNGSIDMELMKANPVFYKCVNGENKIVGVISGFQTSPDEFRSRGIWVEENHRAAGIGSQLIKHLEREALTLGCSIIWSMPRKSSWEFYNRNQFQVMKEINTFEYGPHYLAEKKIEQGENHGNI